jgi:signal transduction histidine kinase
MNTSNEFIFLVSFLITLVMGGVSFLSYQKYRDKELSHLTEFWASLAVNVLAYYIFRSGNPQMLALSMVGWLWPMKTFKLILQNISGKKILYRWEHIALAAGAFLSVALGGYGFSFMVMTMPLSLVVGGIGLYVTTKAYKRTNFELMTPLNRGTFIFMGLLFLERITFPLWRVNPDINQYMFLLGLVTYVGFAGTGISAYMELMRNRQDRLMAQMLKERNEKLLSSSKYSELGMMSAGIAHEINNPLAVIQARTTQLLRVYRNPEKQKDLADGLQQILYTSERINRTIQGVREFVHQDEKGHPVEVSLKDLVDDVLAFTGQRMKNHGVNLRFYGLENFSVVGNKIQLEQIILNLLNNSFDAIEFLPDKWIEVSVHQDGDKVQIYFKDSGDGIPEDIASKMMEPFYTTKDLGKGTGLGLALAKGIAEKHGGTLSYLNNCPHTTFLLELPRSINQDWGIPLH